jgi:integrase/recombinase XerD
MITVVRKGNEIKEIFVTDIILKNIKKYIDNERPNVDNEYLFISNHKKQISVRTFQRTVKKYTSLIVKEEQLHHPHTLRHSFASLTVQHTDINTVKELMNHKNINTTMLYIQSNDKLKRKAITDSYANIF